MAIEEVVHYPSRGLHTLCNLLLRGSVTTFSPEAVTCDRCRALLGAEPDAVPAQRFVHPEAPDAEVTISCARRVVNWGTANVHGATILESEELAAMFAQQVMESWLSRGYMRVASSVTWARNLETFAYLVTVQWPEGRPMTYPGTMHRNGRPMSELRDAVLAKCAMEAGFAPETGAVLVFWLREE